MGRARREALIDRPDPPFTGDERTMLVGWLEFHRDTLAMKCEGLTREQLAERSVPPSSLSLIGLVRHMSELERAYFRRRFAGEDVEWLYSTDAHPEADFEDVADADPDEALAIWREERKRAKEIASAAESLDECGKSDLPLRFWLVKTINEYARHNGHADLLRERIDGTTGE